MELPRIFLLIVLVLLLFAGLASAQGPGPKTVVITKEDNGKEIAVPKGAIFEVRLEHAGGTGYLWEIVEPDETHLKVLGSTEIPLKNERIARRAVIEDMENQSAEGGTSRSQDTSVPPLGRN